MLVVDASFAVEVVLGSFIREPFFEELEKGEEVVVPSIYFEEVANAMWKYVQANLVSLDEAVGKQEEAFSFAGWVVPGKELATEVLAESVKRNHPVYDLFYMVLARRNNATLCTLDKKLHTLCIKEGVRLVCPVERE